MLAVVIAVPVTVVLCLLALGLALLASRRWPMGLGSRVQPPGLGPDTTFLITDIQVRL